MLGAGGHVLLLAGTVDHELTVLLGGLDHVVARDAGQVVRAGARAGVGAAGAGARRV